MSPGAAVVLAGILSLVGVIASAWMASRSKGRETNVQMLELSMTTYVTKMEEALAKCERESGGLKMRIGALEDKVTELNEKLQNKAE